MTGATITPTGTPASASVLIAFSRACGAEARSRRLDADERQVSNPFARIYLRSGRRKYELGDLNGAWIDCELGLSLEETPPLRNLHVAVVRALAGR